MTQEAETLALDHVSPAVWRRACTACTGAKRKCSKQLPGCRRCGDRGLQCVYPPARPVPSEANALEKPHSMSLEQEYSGEAYWFLAPDSWEVAHLPPQPVPELFGEETLGAYVATVQDWLRQWVTDDHCPFIHRYLYKTNMPRRVQDAYSTVCVYLHKTPATESTARRIVEHRLHQLIEESAVESSLDLGLSTTLVDRLARVQALLALLVICLFDGGVRLRAQGELHLGTLLAWNDEMWREAKGEVQGDATLEPWRLWILGESLRRTWLTASLVNGAYVCMNQGYTCCPGGVFCTFGSGLWDAATGHEWEARCGAGRRLFMQSLDVGELLQGDFEGVDAFGHAAMLISFGVDKVQRWMARKDGPALG